MQQRGYDTSGARPILRRLFIESWGEPGLHRFWRAWNPVYGYVLWRLYLALGGRERPLIATMAVFAACGFFAHDLVTWAMTREPTLAITITFVLYGAMTLGSRIFQDTLRQDRLPRLVNAIINLLLLLVGLAGGPLIWSQLV